MRRDMVEAECDNSPKLLRTNHVDHWRSLSANKSLDLAFGDPCNMFHHPGIRRTVIAFASDAPIKKEDKAGGSEHPGLLQETRSRDSTDPEEARELLASFDCCRREKHFT